MAWTIYEREISITTIITVLVTFITRNKLWLDSNKKAYYKNNYLWNKYVHHPERGI